MIVFKPLLLYSFAVSGFVEWYLIFGLSVMISLFIIIVSFYSKMLTRKITIWNSLAPNTLFPYFEAIADVIFNVLILTLLLLWPFVEWKGQCPSTVFPVFHLLWCGQCSENLSACLGGLFVVLEVYFLERPCLLYPVRLSEGDVRNGLLGQDRLRAHPACCAVAVWHLTLQTFPGHLCLQLKSEDNKSICFLGLFEG